MKQGVIIGAVTSVISSVYEFDYRADNYISQGMSRTDAEHRVIDDFMEDDLGWENGIVIKYLHHILQTTTIMITVGNRWFHWEIPITCYLWVPVPMGIIFDGIEGQ